MPQRNFSTLAPRVPKLTICSFIGHKKCEIGGYHNHRKNKKHIWFQDISGQGQAREEPKQNLEVITMFELTRRINNHPISTYNPFREMEEMERRFFNGFFGTQDLAAFRTDVTDEGDHYLLEADLPGFDKQDIHLSIDGDTLTVQAERRSKVDKKDDQNKVIRMERSYGSYSRQFDISAVDAEQIKAKYDNGVLKLTLPKKNRVLPASRQLEIE